MGFLPSSKASSSRSIPSMPSSLSSSSHFGPSTTVSASMMEENMAIADSIITKWNPDSSSYAKITSLFYENRQEALHFLRSVADLQHAMHFYVSDPSSAHKLVHAQRLMQTAMKRLEKEFYQILAANRDLLDSESVSVRSSSTTRSGTSDYDEDDTEDDVQTAGDSVQDAEREASASLALSDLQSIADCMISSGYGKECVRIYNISRKSIVDEGTYRLTFENMSSHHLHKLDWDVLDQRIKKWLHAIKISVRSLFFVERILCDHVFAKSEAIKKLCFTEICKDAALGILRFPESVSKCKKSPEKMFRLLDMYDAISELWPEIESIFSCESTSAVRSQAVASLLKLGEAIRGTLAEFESAMQKESSRSSVPGGGIHPLTHYVMNYVRFLGDYAEILSDIFADYPFEVQSLLPEALLENSQIEGNPNSSISVRIEWLILVLLCKLEGKAELHKDVALSCLFLANNVDYIVAKVRGCRLQFLLGDEWLSKHESKIHQHVANYEKVAWTKVLLSLPPNPKAELPMEEAKEAFRRFNKAFEWAHRSQATWVVPDSRLRDEMKVSIARMIVPPYREFYDKYRVLLRHEAFSEDVVRFAPEDLETHVSDLFHGTGVSDSASATTPSLHSHK